MTKEAALYNFFSGFGISAYAQASVPEDTVFPFLTYEAITDSWEHQNTISVHLWYYGDSEKPANDKAQDIAEAIGAGGKIVPCEGGGMWIKRGSPFCQSVREEDSNMIKHRYLLINIEYLTIN